MLVCSESLGHAQAGPHYSLANGHCSRCLGCELVEEEGLSRIVKQVNKLKIYLFL